MIKIWNFLNENHWYLIAIVIIAGMVFWTYGCESQVSSLLDQAKMINRQELQLEVDYLLGQAMIKATDLDKQDEIKQALYDVMILIGQGGQINSMGVLNLAATIGAIGFGLNRNQKYKAEILKKSLTNPN